MRRKNLLALLGYAVLLFVTIAFVSPSVSSAQSVTPVPQTTYIYLFWGDGCPHCAAAEPFLEELTQRYPNVELRAYEVWYARENQKVFTDMAAAFGFQPQGVPTIFIGDRYWVGYSDRTAQEMEAVVSACVQNGCKDAGAGIVPLPATQTPTSAPATATPETVQAVASPTAVPTPALTRSCMSSAALLMAIFALLLHRWLK